MDVETTGGDVAVIYIWTSREDSGYTTCLACGKPVLLEKEDKKCTMAET